MPVRAANWRALSCLVPLALWACTSSNPLHHDGSGGGGGGADGGGAGGGGGGSDGGASGDAGGPPIAVAHACDDDPAAATATPPWGDPAPACVRVRNVASSAELAADLANAQPGDCLVAADGSYSLGDVSASGKPALPIVVRAQNPGRAAISAGALAISSSAYLVFQGFDWTSSGQVRVKSCDHCRFTRNHFHLAESADMDWIVLVDARDTRIDHNEIGPKNHTGNPVSVFGGAKIAARSYIDHNYFHDIATGGAYPGADCTLNPGGEAIRIGVGTFADQSALTVVENNLFERSNGDPETISSKSSDNVIRYNTLRSSAGSISLRAGNRARVCGNFILGNKQVCSGGIRMTGSDNQVFNNYVSDVASFTMQLHAAGGANGYAPVVRAVVVHNTLLGLDRGLQLGDQSADCTVANNIVRDASGTLIDVAATAPAGLVMMANLAPLGAAKLGPSGAAWTAAFADLDPHLVARGELLVLGPASGNAVDKGAAGFGAFVTVDVDGQARDAHPDIGADELATTPITRRPLTAADVGPAAP